MFQLKERLRAAAWHLIFSFAVAAVVAAVIFLMWYPYPFREISGGLYLFLVIVAVDVSIGPLTTFAVFNSAKGWSVLKKDLLIVCVLQSIALGYGALTVYNARPVHIVYEYDRFRVVHAGDVRPEDLDEAPPGLQSLPFGGPTFLSLRMPTQREKQEYMLAEIMNGEGLSSRPALWQPYQSARVEILRQAKPVKELMQRFPSEAEQIRSAVQASGQTTENVVYASLIGRDQFWTILLDARTANPLEYLPIDPY